MEALLKNIPLVLQALVVLIMFGMGITLAISDFTRVIRFPRAAIIGLSGQLLLFPAIGFFLALSLPLRPEIAMGLILIAACPDGATSNMVSHLSKGDTALAITLTALSGVCTIFTIPIIINLGFSMVYGDQAQAFYLPFGPTVWNLFKLLVLPVGLGMAVRHFYPKFSKKIEKPLTFLAGLCILLALALIALQLSQRGSLWSFFKESGPIVLVLNLLTMILGYIFASLGRLEMRQRVTIAIEAAIQNGTVGISIAASPKLLNNPEMGIPSAVYAIIMCALSLLLFPFFRKMVINSSKNALKMG
jgi:bile acid:Na+ symporter, BASS family